MQGVIFRNRIIWLLTTLMVSLFSILSKNIYASYYLLAISVVVFLIDYRKPGGVFSFLLGKFQFNAFLFFLFCLASATWAMNRDDAIEKSVTVLSLIICMSIFIRHYRFRKNNVELLFRSIMWAGFVVAIYTIIFSGLSNVQSTVSEGGRMDSTYDNVNVIGFFCSITIIIAVFFLLYKKEIYQLVFILPTLLVISGAASRKAFVILFVGVFALFFFRNFKFEGVKTIIRWTILLCIFVVAVKILSSIPMFEGVMSRMEGLNNFLGGDGKVDSSTLERQEYALLGLSVFAQNPLIGIGIGNVHIINLQITGNDTYLHNNFAELLADVGAIGFTLYYYYIFFVLYKIIKLKLYTDPYGKLVIIIWLCLLFADMGSVSYYSKFTYFYMMLFYLFIENYDRKKSSTGLYRQK